MYYFFSIDFKKELYSISLGKINLFNIISPLVREDVRQMRKTY
jgi:hypothetical protein